MIFVNASVFVKQIQEAGGASASGGGNERLSAHVEKVLHAAAPEPLPRLCPHPETDLQNLLRRLPGSDTLSHCPRVSGLDEIVLFID